jgi:hypothetical protein
MSRRDFEAERMDWLSRDSFQVHLWDEEGKERVSIRILHDFEIQGILRPFADA